MYADHPDSSVLNVVTPRGSMNFPTPVYVTPASEDDNDENLMYPLLFI
jgi:hypothetical protein